MRQGKLELLGTQANRFIAIETAIAGQESEERPGRQKRKQKELREQRKLVQRRKRTKEREKADGDPVPEETIGTAGVEIRTGGQRRNKDTKAKEGAKKHDGKKEK